jgi:hypothetical protein
LRRPACTFTVEVPREDGPCASERDLGQGATDESTETICVVEALPRWSWTPLTARAAAARSVAVTADDQRGERDSQAGAAGTRLAARA